MKRSIRRPPYAATLLATTVVLLLLAALALLAAQGERLRRELSESVTVVAELRPGSSDAERTDFTVWLGDQAFAKPNTLAFVDADEGAQRLRRLYGEDFLRAGLDNPLFDLYTFNLSATHTDERARAEVERVVGEHPAVLAAAVQGDYVARLVERVASVRIAGWGLAVILVLGTCLLVVNTARLALLSRATVIRNMELVGASWGFIARPFLIRACGTGLLAGGIAAAAGYALHAYLLQQFPDLWRPIDPLGLLAGAAAAVALGLVLNFATTFLVIRRTLRLRIDDLD